MNPATVGLTLDKNGLWIRPRPAVFHAAQRKMDDFRKRQGIDGGYKRSHPTEAIPQRHAVFVNKAADHHGSKAA